MDRILNNHSEAHLIMDKKGYIRFVSLGMRKFIGASFYEIMGKHIKEVLPKFMIEDLTEGEVELKLTPRVFINKVMVHISSLIGERDEALWVLRFEELIKERKTATVIAKGKAVYTFDKILGGDQDFLKLVEYCKKIADSRSTVLITGESGTGKEVFAQSIHNESRRRGNEFIAVNCGAIPKNLMESELFGYEEGAFTGARKGGCDGKFYQAQGGTIFLDEIGEMPPEMQTKLLRVIEEKVITKIGGRNPIPIDVRIIAATNKNLEKAIRTGAFRKDLYYRINVIPVQLPTLRERAEDIPILVEHIMRKTASKLNRVPYELSQDEMDCMLNYRWPGNIRELENIIEYIINTRALPKLIHEQRLWEKNQRVNEGEKDMNLGIIEKKHILWVLRKAEGNISGAAKMLGIGRNTLYRKLEKYNINPTMERYCIKMK